MFNINGVGIKFNQNFPFVFFFLLQSIAAAISFVYSSHMGLHSQMIILLVFAIMGTISFCMVEWSFKRAAKQLSAQTKDIGDTKLRNESHSE